MSCYIKTWELQGSKARCHNISKKQKKDITEKLLRFHKQLFGNQNLIALLYVCVVDIQNVPDFWSKYFTFMTFCLTDFLHATHFHYRKFSDGFIKFIEFYFKDHLKIKIYIPKWWLFCKYCETLIHTAVQQWHDLELGVDFSFSPLHVYYICISLLLFSMPLNSYDGKNDFINPTFFSVYPSLGHEMNHLSNNIYDWLYVTFSYFHTNDLQFLFLLQAVFRLSSNFIIKSRLPLWWTFKTRKSEQFCTKQLQELNGHSQCIQPLHQLLGEY